MRRLLHYYTSWTAQEDKGGMTIASLITYKVDASSHIDVNSHACGKNHLTSNNKYDRRQ